MKIEKFNWNNGTQSSPIVLTNDQIKKLIAIGKREDIETTVSGWITTSSRKMQKFLKYALEQQFPNLNIICDEELADSFSIKTSTNTIKEGTREFINISTDTGITHDFLQWKYEYSNFEIDGDISEQNIKDRIRVENGQLVIDDPQENASWSAQLTLTAYPIYYNSEDFNNIPTISRPYINFTIYAKKIEDITINVDSEVPINASVNVKVTPVPVDSTKLKGAKYTYSTTTPDILAINTSSSGTEILTKQKGTANLIVTLSACNNTVTRTNSATFNVYDLRPMCFVIDQRYANGLSDPDGMVSENCILDSNGKLQYISSNGAQGDINNNTLTWIRQNTHAYVSKSYGITGLRLKQLDDTNRKKFADGSSAVDYISNTSGEYDVFLKFGSDIYYKTEPFIPSGELSPNEDYVLVTIAKELPAGEDESTWKKWSQYKLIGVYEACKINDKLHSLSGQIPVNVTYNDAILKATGRGQNFNICDYDMTTLFAYLFYGYYSSLDCQKICGYGTINTISGKYYPKRTGLTDELSMIDTTSDNGNGASSPSSEQIKAGYGDDIKSVNFWGLENYWGDLSEWVYNIHTMQAFNPSTSSSSNPTIYVADYIKANGSTIITLQNGTDVTYTSKEDFLADYTVANNMFLAITNNNIVRIVDLAIPNNKSNYVKKLIFGKHADIIPKDLINGATANTGFCDECKFDYANYIIFRSYHSNSSIGGICSLNTFYSVNGTTEYLGARLLYDGDDNTVHVINETESL